MVMFEQGGHTTVINLRIDNKRHEVEFENRWGVPHSSNLSKMFQAHINVEYCNSVKSIKYISCTPSHSSRLWEKYKDRFSEDVRHKKQRENPDIDLHYVPQIYKETLILLDDKCLSIFGKMLVLSGLPVPTRQAHNTLDRDLLRETNDDINILQHVMETNKLRLTENQLMAYEAVMNFIAEGNNGFLFFDAPGGI
ncbi:hypothetical protein AVEN_195646-1 [Araneus ventricosus]|uniref:ATP-dependent DNA helicase n=1 Tax=Araneus ventricosus TaxID=182803 RepID=A0A4Y2BA56_ARAVE|nr:hypothetical protein AVEN_195646-1 [Araneus ventricosus]